jgi:hypothetical protein
MVRTLTMSPRSRLQLWLWAATTLLKHGRPDIVISFLGGLGDDLLCTTAIHEWLQRGAKRIWFISRHPELYRFDSHVRVLPENPALFALARRLKCEPRFLSYSEFDALSDRDTPPPRHLAAEMCARAGLNGRIALRPYLPLTDAELATAAHASGALVVQADGLDAAGPPTIQRSPAHSTSAAKPPSAHPPRSSPAPGFSWVPRGFPCISPAPSIAPLSSSTADASHRV